MEFWAQRQRNTNQLARMIGSYILKKDIVTSDELYALSRLSWVTHTKNNSEGTRYKDSTKMPALNELLATGLDSNSTLGDVAQYAQRQLKNNKIGKLILEQTGFTNFYRAYRNSVGDWIESHHTLLLPMYRRALVAGNDADRLALISDIENLPGIPMANHPERVMQPESFLTPVFFMLDPHVKFPILNGSTGVQNLLRKLGVHNKDLATRYKAVVALYGQGGIRDAADIDQLDMDLPDFLDSDKARASKKMLQRRGDNERDLTAKDEADSLAAKEAMTLTHRKIHNKLTNAMLDLLGKRFTLVEGVNETKFDLLIKRFNGEDSLLIEVKSSPETPHLRMAVGQLYSYWHQMDPNQSQHLAILVPTKPSNSALHFLNWLNIGILWFKGNTLKTSTLWLSSIAETH